MLLRSAVAAFFGLIGCAATQAPTPPSATVEAPARNEGEARAGALEPNDSAEPTLAEHVQFCGQTLDEAVQTVSCNGVDETPVDLTPLVGMKLEVLELQNSVLADPKPLASLITLEKLYLNGSNVVDLTPLRGLVNLERLTLDNTNVTDLEPLAGLSKLEELFLNGTAVSNLVPLTTLTNLRMLVFDRAPPAQVRALRQQLPRLMILP